MSGIPAGDIHAFIRMEMNKALVSGARFRAGSAQRIREQYTQQLENLGAIERIKLLQRLIHEEAGNAEVSGE